MGHDGLSEALARYFASPPVAAWLGCALPPSVSAQALSNSMFYGIALGRKSRRGDVMAANAPTQMDVEDMLCLSSLTDDNFLLGIICGLGQPHAFARTPMMHNVKPICRRFAVDLNQTRCLEVMEFVHFQNGMVCCCFRKFLFTPDGSLPVHVSATLHENSGCSNGMFALGPVIMRSETFEALTCPVCQRENYACACPFAAKSRVMSERFATTSWQHFASKLQRKARYGNISVNVSAVVPGAGEVSVLSRRVDSLTMIVHGQSPYMTLVRRKAVHTMGLVVSYARTDEPLVFGSEAADFLALHNGHTIRRGRQRGKRRLLADCDEPAFGAQPLADELVQEARWVSGDESPIQPSATVSGGDSSVISLDFGMAMTNMHAEALLPAVDPSSKHDVLLERDIDADVLLAAPYGSGIQIQDDSASGELDQILSRVGKRRSGTEVRGLTVCSSPVAYNDGGMPCTETVGLASTDVGDTNVPALSLPPGGGQHIMHFQSSQLQTQISDAIGYADVVADVERERSGAAPAIRLEDEPSSQSRAYECGSTAPLEGDTQGGERVDSRTRRERPQNSLDLTQHLPSAYQGLSRAPGHAESHERQSVPQGGSQGQAVRAKPQTEGAKRRRPSPPVAAHDVANDSATVTKRSATPPSSASAAVDNERKHACTVCPSRFKLRGDLQRHIMVVHEKEKRFECGTCGKTFGHSGHLNRHAQSHRGERRFKCSHCGYKFLQRSHLLSHVEHVHGSSRDRVHGCSLCKLRVATVSELRRHLQTVHKLEGIAAPDAPGT